MDIDRPLETLTRLMARAIVPQAQRQAQVNAAQVVEHQDGDASNPPAERNQDAALFYPTGGTSAS